MSEVLWRRQAGVRPAPGFLILVFFLMLTTAAFFPAVMRPSAWGGPPPVSGIPAADSPKPLTAQDYFRMGQVSASLIIVFIFCPKP